MVEVSPVTMIRRSLMEFPIESALIIATYKQET